MIYQDRVYGKIEINEPLVLELIKSPSFQRLKKVDQAGYPPLYYNPKKIPLDQLAHSRFEHSLGVFILLKKFQASFLEQIAGLIHDLSHGVFSHCLDYALDSGSEKEQNHQDNIYEKFVKKSEIPAILQKNKVDIDFLLNKDNFLLLEKDLPNLCADRLDYSLRTAVIFREIDEKTLKSLLKSLTIKGNQWVFKERKSAKRYAELFLKMNRFYYAGLDSARMFRTTGDLVKYALQKGYLNIDDLYTTDAVVLKKLKRKAKSDKTLGLLLERINDPTKTINNPENYDSQVYCKSRMVDPLFLEKKRVVRLSEVDIKWRKIVKKELQPKLYFLKFIS